MISILNSIFDLIPIFDIDFESYSDCDFYCLCCVDNEYDDYEVDYDVGDEVDYDDDDADDGTH